ncbi:MAG: thymidylate kinase [Clostridia bacterium]|nr:thymidylate kinase [Clostridia bacterium]
MAKLISIDGLDGSGKGTQSELLCRRLIAAGYTAKVLSFPMYDCDSSFGVKLYLDGALGTHPSDMGAYAASTLFAVDRYLSYRMAWQRDLEKYDYIIFNRYVSANAVHQLSKLPREDWENFLSWLCDYEYEKLGLPKPDITLYLLVEPAVSMALVDHRGAKKDIHETDEAYMQACFAAGLYAAKALGFVEIDCCKNGRIRPMDEISDEIFEKVKDL